MAEAAHAIRVQLTRQVAHWSTAAKRLVNLNALASAEAWARLERYLGVELRASLTKSIGRLLDSADVVAAELEAARSLEALEAVRRRLLHFREHYLRTETIVDFYADAINTRQNPEIAAHLRACDVLAARSMREVLDPLGLPTPPVLTYLDKGLGASILKSGLRLWDGGTLSPAAAIKLVFHALPRPTSLAHEAGHQIAHIAHWNNELAVRIAAAMTPASADAAEAWSGWASEIGPDAIAFAHTGYAAVSSLHDVLAADDDVVFRAIPGDPHPVAFLRVLANLEMCRRYFGHGPWDEMTTAWLLAHPMDHAPADIRAVIATSMPRLGALVETLLATPMRAFGGRRLMDIVDPGRVSPGALDALARHAGSALYTSSQWLTAEPLRILALSGLRDTPAVGSAAEAFARQEEWLLRLGALEVEPPATTRMVRSNMSGWMR